MYEKMGEVMNNNFIGEFLTYYEQQSASNRTDDGELMSEIYENCHPFLYC